MNLKNSKELRRFFYKLFFFIITLIILDQLLGNLLRILYFKQNHGSEYKTTYTFEKVNADILIIGSSRAEHHYNPQIFEDSLNMSCYNSGEGGKFIFYYDAVLKCVLKRYKPKIIILDILNDELEKHSENYDRLSCLLPYYYSHSELKDLILLKSPYEKIKLSLSAIYPYNSLIISSFTQTIDIQNRKKDEAKLQGFVPLYNVDKEKLNTFYFKNSIDSNNVNTLLSFIEDCTKNKIKLYITISPIYLKNINQNKSTLLANDIANNYHIPIWDYSQDPYFLNHQELFSDKGHLNVKGATIFSIMIAERIKLNLQN